MAWCGSANFQSISIGRDRRAPAEFSEKEKNRREAMNAEIYTRKLLSALLYIQIFPSREDFPNGTERRLPVGFGRAEAQSRLQVGAPFWLRLRRAAVIAPLRFFLLCVLIAALRAVLPSVRFFARLKGSSPDWSADIHVGPPQAAAQQPTRMSALLWLRLSAL